jgi:F-type H+-transporting ATPase subunit b
MTFNVWTFLFEVINFVVLAYILHRLLYRPLRAAIERRREQVERAQADADQARAAAAATQQELQAKVADIESDRQTLLRQARETAEAERKKLIDESQTQIARRQEETRTALARQRADALHALTGEVRASAVDLAQRLLQESAGEQLQEQLARRLAESLAGLSEAEKSEVRRDWSSEGNGVLLETAAALGAPTTQQLAAAVEAVIGQPARLAVEIRPELVAGARLHIGGHVWDASLAGQLEPLRPRPNGKHHD